MKRGTSPSGKADRPPCRNFAKGKCTKGDECDWWHPQVCKFFKAGNCSEGKKCAFLHPSKDNSAAAAGKQQETASGTKEDNPDGGTKKAKAKAKSKPQANVFLRISSPTSTCMTTVKSKKVRFSKFSQRKSVRDNKQPTYIKWEIKCDEDFKPQMTNPDGSINMPDKEEIEWSEEWSRKLAIRLWNELHPKNKKKWDDFFIFNGQDHLREHPLLKDEGDLQQEDEPEKQEEWKVVVKKKSKKARKKKAAPKAAEKPSSALKGKRKIFCFDCKGGRTYIVDSGASFHLVSRADLSDREVATIAALDEPIPIQPLTA